MLAGVGTLLEGDQDTKLDFTFQGMDRDGDGSVDLDELTRGMKQITELDQASCEQLAVLIMNKHGEQSSAGELDLTPLPTLRVVSDPLACLSFLSPDFPFLTLCSAVCLCRWSR